MKLTRITKYFIDAGRANKYYLGLCEKFDSVKLVRSPFFGEEGQYSWEVK